MKIIITLGFVFAFTTSFSQADAELKYCSRAQNYIQEKWQYFTFNDTLTAKVIQHYPTKILCGTVAVASMTIVELNNGEIIRVLDLCGQSAELRQNQIIKITPAKKPEFKVSLPFIFEKNDLTNKIESKSKEFDLYILKTTWGNL